MSSENYKRYAVLTSSTVAFTVCFMIWMMLAVVGIPIKKQLGLSETQFGFLAALPVLSGSLIRVPLGIWTDKFGGRIVMFVLMILSVPAIFAMQYATQYWHVLAIGLIMGLAGGAFSVGTPYVARWFPKDQQGLAMGIFGAGNAGSALNKFVAPSLIAAGGWTLVPNVYASIMLVTAILFWFFSYHNPVHLTKSNTYLKQQFMLLKEPGVLRYSQYYSVVFGGYVALALWMTKYYIDEYSLTMTQAALLAACFSLPGGVLRALGGYFSDKFGAERVTWGVMLILGACFLILSYPNLPSMPFHLNVIVFTILMFTAGIAMAIGKASVFKFVANDYADNIGAVSGAVGLAGGLGGFLLPILFGILLDWTGIRSTAFMLLLGCTLVSLFLMKWAAKNNN